MKLLPEKQPPNGWTIKLRETGGTVTGADFLLFLRNVNAQLSANGFATLEPEQLIKRMQSPQRQDFMRESVGDFDEHGEPIIDDAPHLLTGQWRHFNGMLFCGTLRIAKADFDTDPSDIFRTRVFDHICQKMNEPC